MDVELNNNNIASFLRAWLMIYNPLTAEFFCILDRIGGQLQSKGKGTYSCYDFVGYEGIHSISDFLWIRNHDFNAIQSVALFIFVLQVTKSL